MDTINETFFSVTTILWEDLERRPKLTVIVKGTFAFRTEPVAAMAAEQLPILVADESYKEHSTGSTRFETDMVPFKPFADVILVGRAFAPGGRPVTRLDVVIRVGRLNKMIRVFGDRKWWF